MQKFKTACIIVITLVVISVSGYVLFRIIHFVIKGILSLNSSVSAAIIAAIATVIVSVVRIIYSQLKSKERDIAESHLPKKIELYKSFMDEAVVGILRLTKKKDGKSIDDKDVQKRIEDFFFKFTGDVIVWGSPQVIKSYSEFRKIGNNPEIILKVDDMLRAIRKDLGHSNRRIKRGDLISLFLTDPEKVKEMIEKKPGT